MSRKVCVVTGGGSGIGLAAAKELGKDHFVIVAGRTQKKLDMAVSELLDYGIEAEVVICDVSNRDSVDKLVAYAKGKGTVTTIIHAAGISPNMGDPSTIIKINALGTINVNDAFFNAIGKGSCLIDIASMSGHLFVPTEADLEIFKLSRVDKKLFVEKMLDRVNLFPENLRRGMAYCISKNFVIWYAKTDVGKFGQRGARILSISPGTFETPMGETEKNSTENYIRICAIKRMGKVDEMARLISFCADKVEYLTGADILCDGGFVAAYSTIPKQSHS